MIKLYGLELSFPVNRVRLCLNAMGQEYEYIRVMPMSDETQNEDYLKLHPAGKVPALDDDGFGLFESNAIMKYLCRKYNSDFYPNGIVEQAHVDKWLDYTTTHVGNAVGKVLFNTIIVKMVDGDVDERSLKEGYEFLKRFLTIIDKHLANSTYLAGDSLSIADFCLLATVDPAEVVDVDISEYPNLHAWRNKLMAEDFYKKMHNSYGETLEAIQKAMA